MYDIIDADTAEDIEQFLRAREWELGEWELLPGVWLHIDWSKEGMRDRPVVFVNAEDNGLDGYEPPEGFRFLEDVSDEAEDLSIEIEQVFADAEYAGQTSRRRFESDGHLSQGAELFHF